MEPAIRSQQELVVRLAPTSEHHLCLDEDVVCFLELLGRDEPRGEARGLGLGGERDRREELLELQGGGVGPVALSGAEYAHQGQGTHALAQRAA